MGKAAVAKFRGRNGILADMGTDYVWVCDERKEFIDPYPLDEAHLFAWCDLGDWQGCKVRLLSDFGGGNDEYYLRTCRTGNDAGAGDDPEIWGGGRGDVYTDVTAQARAHVREIYPHWFDGSDQNR
jgi:hypothetical protein